MSTHEKDTFMNTYEWASAWKDLPWAHDEPTLFLAEICRRRKPGKALDIGCGAGTDSVFLAEQGWDVTSLDFVPKALEFTSERAAKAGVSVTPVEADITTWTPPHSFDLVLDHGLLHNMDPVRYAKYREVVMKAIGDTGEFVLLHWHPLFPGQPNGDYGPTRVSREDIKTFFAPELQERFATLEYFESLPSAVGGGMIQAYYWFKPNQVFMKPAELLQQIRTTLAANDVDVEAASDEAGDPDLLATVVGPGRLGLHHEVPLAGDVAAIIDGLAERTGENAAAIHKLLAVFSDAERGNICIADARCAVCAVDFCKRRRYR